MAKKQGNGTPQAPSTQDELTPRFLAMLAARVAPSMEPREAMERALSFWDAAEMVLKVRQFMLEENAKRRARRSAYPKPSSFPSSTDVLLKLAMPSAIPGDRLRAFRGFLANLKPDKDPATELKKWRTEPLHEDTWDWLYEAFTNWYAGHIKTQRSLAAKKRLGHPPAWPKT